MAELYRKSALERISSPDQLDTMLKISSPISWLALVGAALYDLEYVVQSTYLGKRDSIRICFFNAS